MHKPRNKHNRESKMIKLFSNEKKTIRTFKQTIDLHDFLPVLPFQVVFL